MANSQRKRRPGRPRRIDRYYDRLLEREAELEAELELAGSERTRAVTLADLLTIKTEINNVMSSVI